MRWAERQSFHLKFREEKLAEFILCRQPDLINMDGRKAFVTGGPQRVKFNRKFIILVVIIFACFTAFTAGTAISTGASTPTSPNIGDPMPAPSGMVNVPVNTGFQWASISGADSYEIQIADNADFSNPIDTKVANTVWAQPQNLNYGATYYWRVRGFTGTITSDWTDNTFTTLTQPGASFTKL